MPILGVIASSISGNLYSASYDSIATTTVGAGGTSEIVFNSIPAGYTHLQLRGIGRAVTAGGRFRLQFNSDTGSTYTYHLLAANGSILSSLGGGNFDKITLSTTPDPVDLANCFVGMVIDILDYANTSKHKTVRTFSGLDLNGSGELGIYSGAWRNTNAITSIRFFNDAGNIAQNSQVALYGIKVA